MRDASLCADEDGGYYDNLLTSPASRFPGPVGGVSTSAGFAPRRAKSQRDAKASHPFERKIVSFVFYSRVFCSTYFCARFNLYLIEVDNRYHPRISHEAFYICKYDEACTRTTEVSHRNLNLMRPRTRCERRNTTSSNDRNNVSPSDSIRFVR